MMSSLSRSLFLSAIALAVFSGTSAAQVAGVPLPPLGLPSLGGSGGGAPSVGGLTGGGGEAGSGGSLLGGLPGVGGLPVIGSFGLPTQEFGVLNSIQGFSRGTLAG